MNKKQNTKQKSDTPALKESEIKRLLQVLGDQYSISTLAQKSYLLSSFWAWVSQIRLEPHVRVPIPRFLSRRDP